MIKDATKILSVEYIDEDTFKIHCSELLVLNALWIFGPDRREAGIDIPEHIEKLTRVIFTFEGIEKLCVERYSMKILKGKAIICDPDKLVYRVLGAFLDHAFGYSVHASNVELLLQRKDGQVQKSWNQEENSGWNTSTPLHLDSNFSNLA